MTTTSTPRLLTARTNKRCTINTPESCLSSCQGHTTKDWGTKGQVTDQLGPRSYKVMTLDGEHSSVGHEKRGSIQGRIKDDVCTPKERISQVAKWCSDRGQLKWDEALNRSYIPDFLVDERQQLLICDPFIVSRHGLTLKRFTDISLNKYKRLHSYGTASYMTIISTYKRVLHVRHPFERLIEAFKPPPRSLSRKALYTSIWNTIEADAKERERSPKFKHFAQYVARRIETHNSSSLWKPYYNACHPCWVKFDFIVRSEKSMPTCNCYSASDDLQGELGYHIQTKEDSATLSKRIDAYQDVDNKTMNILQSYFSSDMSLFGYQFSAKLQGSCWYNQTGCC
ncbi:hypothetical protein CAPTEDRAFT_225241 [Capitella teleta]|uniref:Carbohydrate sulfotransferase n=1 Tax=Capitella teleta TaxID=283909 RepID=R7UFU0_CAPTE|nr:hypothetical protein CAPTEDRAFT_225241 [Capitella teleta]|eukprot:ELU05404.1 hypothetical protein CAPTEDRAFT_225241 [Capitella teleta]